MYRTGRTVSKAGRTKGEEVGDGTRTLIVSYGGNEERQQESPHSEAAEDGGYEAGGIELVRDVGDFGIGRGRHKASVDRHLGVGSWRSLGGAGGGSRGRERREGRDGVVRGPRDVNWASAEAQRQGEEKGLMMEARPRADVLH